MIERVEKHKRDERRIRARQMTASMDLGSSTAIREVIDVLNGCSCRSIRWLSAEQVAPGMDEQWREAEINVCSLLRSYVDPWLNSGLCPHGEIPGARGLSEAAAEALNLYVKLAPPTITFYPRWKVAPSVTFGEPEYLKPSWGKARELVDPLFFPRMEAARLFGILLLTEQRKTLCKCRYGPCGKYFQKEEPDGPYVRGTFCCPAHSRRDSGATGTRKRRKECNQRLVEKAAEKLLEWESKSSKSQKENGPMKIWLTAQVNAYIARDPRQIRHGIKPNWLKVHRAEIDQAVQTRLAQCPNVSPELKSSRSASE